jgi:Bacteriocin-protection, YdeI or OmpD-Associated
MGRRQRRWIARSVARCFIYPASPASSGGALDPPWKSARLCESRREKPGVPGSRKSRKEKRDLAGLRHETKRLARIPYSDAVEEALCFGWIDGVMKKIDANYFAQRFSPRRSPKSQLSETNKERVRRLIRAGLMTSTGLEKIRGRMSERFVHAPDIIAALKRDSQTWKNFHCFPKWYQLIRLGWLGASLQRPEIFQARLRYFLKMTVQNKRYGMVT